uniref:Exocyst complex component 6B (Trinotate prediction) n=1 Tax=Myxobolus squamalis TaxID=59785 RepID=A0A6B2G1P7_MYXSQ
MDPSTYLENDETYTCITDRYTNLPEIIKNAYENGKISSMLEKLNEIIEFSQKEIDSVCRNDSLNILDCLNGLDRLKVFYETVKKSYLSLNFKVDEVFSEYDKSIGELQKYQTIERNISMTVQFLVKCLPALTIDKIFDQHIDPSNYIDLIDSCCKLEKMHDPIVSQIPIIKRIYDSIPRIRDSIKSDTIENLKTFLNKTLENFPIVGFRYWSKVI